MNITVLSGIVGSTAYGLAGPDSDVDRLGIFVAPTEEFLGLGKPQESIVKTNPDVTLHEVGKFLRLALQGNPTVMELLWLPEHLYEERDLFGRQLIGMRKNFLCAKNVRNAYLGYANQQFKRLMDRGDGSFSSDTRKRTAKHARHLLRLLDQGTRLYTTGELQIELSDPQRYFDFGEQVASGETEQASRRLCLAEAIFDNYTSALPAEPDYRQAEQWLIKVRRYYL